ncbi:hypothetical protein BpHYR1_010238 [Brachionus plicatilis]|uniref:G-protein coupled receptors family 1 profile domain-containing protein n=1 Tax=Brachionus plicatilis TaxID=10195 RepID=A0A3M7R1K9_BRAPC|nr:hypothetical protein BpHYR1_010238 [Brachionus plicatilis]
MFNNSTTRNVSVCAPNFDAVSNTSLVTNYIDIAVRFVSVCVHLVYAAIVLNVKKLRNSSYMLMHHVNLVSFIYVLQYMAFISQRTLLFGNLITLEIVLCTISELSWSVFRFLRTYSILLLAIYRYISVNNIQLLRKLNRKKNLLLIICCTWLAALLLTLVLKFSLSTTYSVFFCSPGYSDSIVLILINFVMVNFLSNVLPTTFILVLYVSISRKINKSKAKLRKRVADNKVSQSASSSSGSNELCKTKAIELKFAKQFFFINLISVLASLCSIFVDFLMVFASHRNFCYFDVLFMEFRPVIRVLFLICQSFIPVLSIFYNPEFDFKAKIKTFFGQ